MDRVCILCEDKSQDNIMTYKCGKHKMHTDCKLKKKIAQCPICSQQQPQTQEPKKQEKKQEEQQVLQDSKQKSDLTYPLRISNCVECGRQDIQLNLLPKCRNQFHLLCLCCYNRHIYKYEAKSSDEFLKDQGCQFCKLENIEMNFNSIDSEDESQQEDYQNKLKNFNILSEKNIYRFDIQNGMMDVRVDVLPIYIPQYSASVLIKHNQILLSGGIVRDERIYGSNYSFILKLKADQWEVIQLTNLNFERYSHQMINIKGNVYALAGQKTPTESIRSCEVYDQFQWKKISDMNNVRSTFTSHKSLNEEFIFVFGGFAASNNELCKSVERYSVQQDKWDIIHSSQEEIKAAMSCVRLTDNQILLLGGSTGILQSKKATLFDEQNNSIKSFGQEMNNERSLHCSFKDQKNKIWIFGGFTSHVEYYEFGFKQNKENIDFHEKLIGYPSVQS